MPHQPDLSKTNTKLLKNPRKGARILKAAESIFAEKGFQSATISDIAKIAKVSEATIYEYFSSKEELLFAIPAETIKEYHEKNSEILPYIQGAASKLSFLIKRHLGLYMDNPDYANVVMLNLKVNRNFLQTEAYRIVQSSARNYIRVIEEGIHNGEFRSEINPYLVRSMIWGTIEHSVTRRSMIGEPHDLMALADDICDTIFAGIRNLNHEPNITVNVMLKKTE
ncbi:MAG: TetR/AcrR family transcriptional regulator [Deltaproteobacteria bacterium]|nr:TetR/AcrR family transcriptional regulator [Deltaproteobacteria bacterium]